MAREARQGFPVASPGHLPASLSSSTDYPARRSGRACRFGGRNHCSDGSRENAEERSSDGLPIVFGENGGYYSPDAPRGSLPGSPRENRVDAGKAWACQEMHEPDAVAAVSTRRRLRSDLRVPVPAESEPTSAHESEKCFSEKNTHRPDVCGRVFSRPQGSAAPRSQLLTRCLWQRDVPKLPGIGCLSLISPVPDSSPTGEYYFGGRGCQIGGRNLPRCPEASRNRVPVHYCPVISRIFSVG